MKTPRSGRHLCPEAGMSPLLINLSLLTGRSAVTKAALPHKCRKNSVLFPFYQIYAAIFILFYDFQRFFSVAEYVDTLRQ